MGGCRHRQKRNDEKCGDAVTTHLGIYVIIIIKYNGSGACYYLKMRKVDSSLFIHVKFSPMLLCVILISPNVSINLVVTSCRVGEKLIFLSFKTIKMLQIIIGGQITNIPLCGNYLN